jgi:hypothetical protein
LDFNPACFVDVAGFGYDEECVEHVLALASSPERLDAMSRAPRLAGGTWPDAYTPAHLSSTIERALAERPVAEARGTLVSTCSHLAHAGRTRLHDFLIGRANRAAGN